MQLNTLKRNTPNTATRRIGRGGKRGKTSGHGGKGQTARAGARVRPEIRDFIKKLPKRRGFGVNRARTVSDRREERVAVKTGDLDRVFAAGAVVTPQAMVAQGLVRARAKKAPVVKIVLGGELRKALTVSGCVCSQAARAAIEQAGGSVL